jgi:predicted O-methyltransferase YrrM
MFNFFRDEVEMEILRGCSRDALPNLPKNNFDLIYPDGDHSYHGVSVDIDNCCSLVRDGGILCGDDLEIQAITAMLRLR